MHGDIDEAAYYPFELTSAQILEHYALGIGSTAAYVDVILQDSPYLYWKLDEANIGSLAQNTAQSGTHQGSFRVDVLIGETGIQSRAIFLSSGGADGIVQLRDTLSNSFRAPVFTMECWGRSNSWEQSGRLPGFVTMRGESEINMQSGAIEGAHWDKSWRPPYLLF